ncbi:hypothetical protein ACQP2F_32825 [Actinoplanes sp. CA-030573]|uniref:hypothetical protein n=1 Tax=Actinoplanes sp. CA-030573 TaxID=3239898 RepID=UPI003D91BB7F
MDPKILIPAAVALLVAVLGAAVTFRMKWIDRQSAVEQRHAQARETAYDYLMAAGDAVWNFIARNYVHQVDQGDELPDDDREAVLEQAETLLQQGFDQLKAHTRSFESVQPVLADFYRTIFNNTQGSSAEYERVRARILDCRRRDTGLKNALNESRRSSWKKRRDALRQAKENAKDIQQVIHDPVDGVTIITGDGPGMSALLREQFQWSNEMRASVETSRRRLLRWKREGLWVENVPERSA